MVRVIGIGDYLTLVVLPLLRVEVEVSYISQVIYHVSSSLDNRYYRDKFPDPELLYDIEYI